MAERSDRDRIAEAARKAISDRIVIMYAAAGGDPKAQHDLLLGALAGVVQVWCAAAAQDITRSRMKEALAGSVAHFVDQAMDRLHGPLQ